MRIILNLVLIALIAALAYLLYSGIAEPIKFKAEKDKRQEAVVAQLEDIRTSQELYRDITGKFANGFDSLTYVLKTDSIPFRQVLEDPEFPGDPDKFIVNTIYSSAIDSINAMGIDLDGLANVPYSNGAKFSITSDTMTYQKTKVWVTETMTQWSEFMGSYASTSYMKYDDTYNPANMIGFGSLNSPNLEGNWK
tara:strand:- start:20 stop:601 length:582 start_codon:yes stop_codon:yes gene_type:complete